MVNTFRETKCVNQPATGASWEAKAMGAFTSNAPKVVIHQGAICSRSLTVTKDQEIPDPRPFGRTVYTEIRPISV